MKPPGTYIRKIEPGKYEYGFVQRSANFRKRADIYAAVGVEASVSDAEASRATLDALQERGQS